LALVEQAKHDGIAPYPEQLSDEARAPGELFTLDPGAVIALAHADVERMRERQ
jgi:hypothetical protein